MSTNPPSPLSENQLLNPVHDLVHRMFPDGEEYWAVSEILTTAQRLYDHPEDLRWNLAKIHRAIVVLRSRSQEHPTAVFQELVTPAGNRYPPASCRQIVREVINGRLPKKFE